MEATRGVGGRPQPCLGPGVVRARRNHALEPDDLATDLHTRGQRRLALHRLLDKSGARLFRRCWNAAPVGPVPQHVLSELAQLGGARDRLAPRKGAGEGLWAPAPRPRTLQSVW